MVINYLKAGVAALVVICLTVLLAIHSIDQVVAVGLIGTIVGYVTGNGVNAAQGRRNEPIIKSKQPPRDDT